VRALYVSGVNIAVTYPDTPRTLAALRGLDCLIVATDTLTPVAHLADVVLPKTVGLEEEQVQWQPKGPCISYTAAVLPPRGEARNDTDIAVALLDALRARGAVRHELLPWRSHAEFLRAQLGDSGLTLEELRAHGYVPIPYQYRDYARFRTPTGKVELYATRLAQHGLPPLPTWDDTDAPAAPPPEYPLRLLTGTRSIVYHHSRFRDHAWARRKEPEPRIHVHPDTAAALGLADGIWVEGRLPGRPEAFSARLCHDDRVPPGVASTGMGWWQRAPDGAPDLAWNINNCTAYGPPWDPVIGCPTTRGLPCQLRPLVAPPGA
jgi:anaerobic selenocysteine-containing dehydrogenase